LEILLFLVIFTIFCDHILIFEFLLNYHSFFKGETFSSSYILKMQVITSSNDKSGRLAYEATACLAVMLYRVTLGLKNNISTKGQKQVDNSLLQILDHACNSPQFLELLFQCLAACGSPTHTEPSNLIPAACESCKVIWYLVYALEIMSLNNGHILFPLACWRRPDQDPLKDLRSAKLVDVVSRALLDSRQLQIALYYCLHNGLESCVNAILQVSVFLFTFL
jgi:fused